jgi:phenylpropionate dioxygenase-like ring-hydroxylating dioxygenase large terminal subunit
VADAAHWYPLCLDSALQGQPLAVAALGLPLVLWRDAQGQPVLMRDRCPHRGARLSMGQVEAGHLACPYHGWRFNGAGHCVGIPALPGFEPPPTHAVERYATALRHGLVWGALAGHSAADGSVPDACPARSVAPAETPPAHARQPAAPPALPDLPARHLLFGPIDVAVSAPRVIENFLDTAHFAFVHAGWLGDALHAEVPPYTVTHTPDGRPVIEHYPAWQPRATASASRGGWVSYRYEVLGPTCAWLRKQPDDGSPGDCFAMWACPLDDESCRVWMAQYTADTVSTDEALRDFQLSIFAQDKPVLESQQPKQLPLQGGELHCAADRLSVAYRRYLLAIGAPCGVC